MDAPAYLARTLFTSRSRVAISRSSSGFSRPAAESASSAERLASLHTSGAPAVRARESRRAPPG
jgi:purine nucleoside permease